MSSNSQLDISGIVPSASQPSEDQENGYNSDDYDYASSEGTAESGNRDNISSEQPNSILAQFNQASAVEPTIIPTEYDSFVLSAGSATNYSELERNEFEIVPGEKYMKPYLRSRAVKILKVTSKVTETETETVTENDTKTKCSCFTPVVTGTFQKGVLTEHLQMASSQGWNMIKTVAFPSIPAFLQDLWVLIELLISTIAFFLGIFGTFPIESFPFFYYPYFILTVISMILALIDAYYYFFEVGSCARLCRYMNKVYKSRVTTEVRCPRKTCLSPSALDKLKTFFELGRNITTELLLYPLLVFDLFSFQLEQTYNPEDVMGRLDYSLFIIGSFYLLLGVYIMRLFVIFGAMYSILKMPSHNKSASSSVIVNFCIHASGQIIVHLCILLVIGAKINNENPVGDEMSLNSTMNGTEDGDQLNVSPFLWISIILGWILPLAGTASYFVVNYYWLREFTVDFWLNMISLLQGASFAETVFGGEGLSETKDRTLDFVKNTDYKQVKMQIVIFKNRPWWVKTIYFARVPITAICSILYNAGLIVFIISLILTTDSDGVVRVAIPDDVIFTAILIPCVAIILVANIRILAVTNIFLFVVVVLILICLPVIISIILIVIFVYGPSVGLLGYAVLIKHLCCKKKSTEAAESV